MFKLFRTHNDNVYIDYESKYNELLIKYTALSNENSDLKYELDSIKKQVQDAKLKPALTNQCKNCKYCVTSKWDGDILGCCKGLVCDDFEKNDEE